MDAVEIFIQQYEAASGKGGLLELHARLLADKIDELDSISDAKLEVVLNGIIVHFKAHLKDGEADLLHHARVLRNKVLHVDLEAAANKVRAPSAGVRMFSGVPTEGKDILKFLEGIAGGTVQGKTVRDQSVASVGIFGWLLESGANGTFVECHKVLVQAANVLNRLAGL